ncbi:MAG: glycosyltransferase [Phycisphaerae bacterium]|nr:MAG: hypothetical protein EDS66_03540 [Planctomycetota bacterium]KAB2945188.1 MAG: glycosyltransferase family 4 protein [Phycisphaerae bacterium]MBE7455928.1 glycosyltransferase [Planctomycetia bacterium]MCK6464651.1 glycosyltransferase [Phycisphaerae bacterium]MCL4717186.1 glycosyltransferase [Phycisphaerae bacterium]
MHRAEVASTESLEDVASPRRSVLIVACTFPPTGGSGVQRPAKFAKYLARLGWDVRVWCGKELPGFPVDATLLDDLPAGVRVEGLPVRADRAARRRRFSCGWPDERLEWAARSYPRLMTALRREPVDAIFSTFSPPSNHLLGWALAARFRVPWVADFRDLWTDDCAYAGGSLLRRFLDRRLERFFIRHADAVTAVSDAQARLLAERDPGRPQKFVTITNGVDLEDFAETTDVLTGRSSHAAEREDRPAQFILAHVGRLERQRFGPELVEGFARFVRHDAERGRSLRLRIVGPANAAVVESLRAAGIDVEQTGPIDHGEAIRQMRDADALLLPAARGRNAESLIPGKTFEYLASGRMIWFVGSVSCEAWRRIEAIGGGEQTDPAPEAIATQLASLAARWRGGLFPAGCRREALAAYTREALAQRLGEVLERVIEARRGRKVARYEEPRHDRRHSTGEEGFLTLDLAARHQGQAGAAR